MWTKYFRRFIRMIELLHETCITVWSADNFQAIIRRGAQYESAVNIYLFRKIVWARSLFLCVLHSNSINFESIASIHWRSLRKPQLTKDFSIQVVLFQERARIILFRVEFKPGRSQQVVDGKHFIFCNTNSDNRLVRKASIFAVLNLISLQFMGQLILTL